MAVQPPTSLWTSHSFGGMVKISPISPALPGSPWANSSFVQRVAPSFVPNFFASTSSFEEGLEVFEEVPGHPVDRQTVKKYPGKLCEVHEGAVLDCIGIRVDADRLPEYLFECLPGRAVRGARFVDEFR